MRGFIGGLAIGLVTVVLGVVVLTLLWPATPRPEVADGAPRAATGDGAGSEAGVASASADNDLIELAPTALTPPADQGGGQDTLAALQGDGTRPAKKPSVGVATFALGNPGDAPAAPKISVEGDAPVAMPAAGASGLSAPQGESNPGTTANPSQPVAGDGSQTGVGFGTGSDDQDNAPKIAARSDPALATTVAGPEPTAPAAGQEPVTRPTAAPAPQSQIDVAIGSAPAAVDPLPQVSGVSDAAPTRPAVAASPKAPGTDTAPVASTRTATAPASQAGPVAAPVPEVGQTAPGGPTAPSGRQIAATPAILPTPSGAATATPNVDQSARPIPQTPVPQTPIPQTPVPQTPEADTPQDRQITALPQAGTDTGDVQPRIGKRVVPLTERNKPVPVAASDGAEPSDAAGGNQTPIKANAEPFDNSENRPLMSIVLIDDAKSLGGEALTEFPYPLSFAIDPGDPEAAAKMARHRAAGFEVVLLTDLAPQATAQDAEVSLSVWMNDFPQVVALLEGTKSGFQGNRGLADQVTAIVDQSGLGLIMQARGLNTAFKLAARDGVPAALVFRDFDGAGQSPVVMRRFLDQAAFRAGQNGGVVMLGRLRPDTISALLIWGLQDRATRVALSPVSALLTRE